MSNLYREPSIDASYQVSVHLVKRFQRIRFLKNRPIRNKNCLWRPCLLMDREEMNNLYRGPSTDVSYQVSGQLTLRFQRRLKCEKLTDDGCQLMAKAHKKELVLTMIKLINWLLFIQHHYPLTLGRETFPIAFRLQGYFLIFNHMTKGDFLEGWEPINQFNTVTFLCLDFQHMSWSFCVQ